MALLATLSPGPPASTAPGPAAAFGPAAAVPVEVFATGLVNPRGLAIRLDGTVLVAEAGAGGSRLVDDGGSGDGPYRLGRSGRVTRFTPAGDRSIVARDLPSLVTAGGAAFGPSAVATLGERPYVRIDFGQAKIDDPEYQGGLLVIRPDGRSERLLTLPAVDRVPPSSDRLRASANARPEPAAGLLALEGRLYLADPPGKQLLQVRPTGETTRLSEYPTAERVPVAIATGGDGALYVAESEPEQVTRIGSDGRLSVAATGLRDPIGLTVDRTGALYVLESAGRVVRVGSHDPSRIEVVAEGLPEATALTAGLDGNLYLATGGRSSRGGEGQLVRLRLVPPGDPWPRRLIVAVNWAIGLGVFAVAMAIGLRFRERGQRPPPPEPTG